MRVFAKVAGEVPSEDPWGDIIERQMETILVKMRELYENMSLLLRG